MGPITPGRYLEVMAELKLKSNFTRTVEENAASSEEGKAILNDQ